MGRRITHYPFRDRARMGEQRWVQKTIRAACGIRAYGASVRYVTCIDCRQLIELRMFSAERDIQALAPQPGEHPRRARANARLAQVIKRDVAKYRRALAASPYR